MHHKHNNKRGTLLIYIYICFSACHSKRSLSSLMQSFKWQDYMRWQRKINEAKASEEALKASLDQLEQRKQQVPESKWKAMFRRSRLEEVTVVKNNIYDKGLLLNIWEIIYPFSSRRSFSERKSKSG